MFNTLVMHKLQGREIPALKIDTPYGCVYAYKIKNEMIYELPSGRARGNAEKFISKSAEEVRALILVMQDQL